MNPCIAVDARMVGMGGIGRYTESLLSEMIRQKPGWRWMLIGDPARLAPLEALGAAVEIRGCRAAVYSLEEAFGMSRFYQEADLVHVPHFNAPMSCRPKLVVTLHDLIHFDHPEYQPFPGANRILDFKLKRLLRRADAVVTVSRATADALKNRYPSVPLDVKTRVIWEAAEAVFGPEPAADDAARLKRMGLETTSPFVLYVGAIREHKQTHLLAAAHRALLEEHPELRARLVLAGKVDPRFDRKHHFYSKIMKKPGVTHLTDARDADLASLYRRAAAVVMPSKAEGFGLPVLEAMRSGAPVLISDIPALKEIAGSAGAVFPPGRMDALKELLYNVLTDSSLRARMSREGCQRAALFSWTRAAAQTLDVYEKVLKS